MPSGCLLCVLVACVAGKSVDSSCTNGTCPAVGRKDGLDMQMMQIGSVASNNTSRDVPEARREWWLYDEGFSPTFGDGGMMPLTLPHTCGVDRYMPSAFEVSFKQHVLDWSADEATYCSHMNESSESWVRQVQAKEPAGTIFSRFCKKGQMPQLIEPLAGILRDPRYLCHSGVPHSSIEWLVLGDTSLLEQGGKNILFDAGGSRFLDAMRFFSSHYEKRGITFDHIYVWEANKWPEGAYWDGVPEETRKYWEPRLTFNNGVPVQAEVGHVDNPVDQIYKLCSPRDFCSFKLDIDCPSVEYPLVQQLLANPDKTGAQLDEFFFEHHVHGLMQIYGWGTKVNGTYADSYDIFTRLREMGVRAHSWI